jgi:SAM-dependent methyltransferase
VGGAEEIARKLSRSSNDAAISRGGKAADFWSSHQPGFRFTSAPAGTPEFFAEVERHRYSLEPHIPQMVQFERWRDKDVLEVGCGIATDGINLARSGAHYVGVDPSPEALTLARRRFELERAEGQFAQASAEELPFDSESFDLVFSHGVIHHLHDTEGAVREFHRVLRPGGTALVMVYHRNSLNYRVNIMVIRRLLAPLLLVPGGTRLAGLLTGEKREVVEQHRSLLRMHGLRYLTDRGLFLSNNTDGPGNPLSKVFSRAEAERLFGHFASVQTRVRFLNLRIVPGGGRLTGTRLAHHLERRVGWHLYIAAKKSATNQPARQASPSAQI